MKTYTQEQLICIQTAQTMQVIQPTRAIVNGESSFVKQTIQKTDVNLANDYWSWVCSFPKDADRFGETTRKLQEQLEIIDKNQNMAAWGYSGT